MPCPLPSRTLALVGLLLGAGASLGAQGAAAPATSQPQFTLRGSIVLSGYYTGADADLADVPTLARLPSGTETTASSGSTVRQSHLRALGAVPWVLGGTLSAEVDVDFAGDASLTPTPRLRRAVARVEWPYGWLLMGQEELPVAEVNPSSLTSIATSQFTNAGNLAVWLPQVRLGAATAGPLRLGAEVAAVAPRYADDGSPVLGNGGGSEQVHRPFLQARLLAMWDNGEWSGTTSVGAHYGWFFGAADTLLAARAVALSTQFTLTRYAELRAEAFLGEGLATMGGALGQNLGPNETLVGGRGAWAQLLVHPTPAWELGGGYGFDDPEDLDVAIAPEPGLLKNTTWEIHGTWRPGPLVFGVEYRRIETRYGIPAFEPLATVDFVGVGMGVEF